ncbi:MAG: ubiquinone biosynthesis accessory factor UbiJ [Polaromonas sp.]
MRAKGLFILQNRGRMNNTSPFSFLESLVSRFQPPAWVVDEGQHRLVLFLNHVLMQEQQAQDRLVRQKGRVIHVRWGLFAIDLVVTPAGLVDRAPPSAKPDLVLSVATESPLAVMQSVLAGKPPPVKIEGEVQLAAELGWLAENLRWDAEEDLSRLLGDVPAHALADAGRRLLTGLQQFLAQGPLSPASSSSPVSSPAPERGDGPPRASSAAAGGSQETEARNLDAQFSDRPPLGKLAPSGGSEDTPVPNGGATDSSAGANTLPKASA